MKRQLAKQGDVQTIPEKHLIGENAESATPAITLRICRPLIGVTIRRRAIKHA